MPNLKIHFLNVGHGDCTIIQHPSGRVTVIDMNNGDKIDRASFDEMREDLQRAGIGPANDGIAGHSALSLLSAGLMGTSTPRASLADYMLPPQPTSALGLAEALLSAIPDPYRDYQRLKALGYQQELTNPVEYLAHICPDKMIFRYIQTHPDLDHMRGLSSLLSAGFNIYNFWDTEHAKEIPDFRFDSDRDDWNAYQKLGRGDRTQRMTLARGDRRSFWAAANGDPGDGIEILAPTPELTQAANDANDHNDHSYVIRLTYGGFSIILGGDAGERVWDDIAHIYGENLRCNVLKASHHGRESGYHRYACTLMKPTHTIVSVGKKPSTDASNSYRAHSANVWSTRWHGNLILEVDAYGNHQWTNH